ncbi:MAG: glycosyltransferase family 2 protein [Polyangiales bacterium]
MTSGALISVVVPVYNEAAGIREFHARVSAALQSLDNDRYELIYVDDGSRDDSFATLRELADDESRVRVVKFSRNFGHQIAITAGLDYARGDAIVFIDADLQDPPELIPELVRLWRTGNDVVYAQRTRRKGETRFKLVTAAMFYRVLRSITQVDIPRDTGDFRIISRRVADELRTMREKDRFMRGLVSWIGFRQSALQYERDERFSGETKYPLRKMLKFALDGLTSFSTAPLRLATWLGYGAAALAFLYLSTVFVQKLLGYTVQGWATIMVALLFLGGVQLICLGILGEYLGRIFNEIKPRPIYIVEEALGTRSSESVARLGGRSRSALEPVQVMDEVTHAP